MSSENNLRLVCQLGEGCEMSQILASPRPPTGFPLGAMHDRHSGSSSKVTRTRRVTRDIRALGDEIATERATTAYISTVSSDSPLSIPSVSRKPLFNSTENARNPMCTTSLSMTAINQRLDAPSEFYQSPSSVSDMEVNQDAPVKRRKVCDDYGVATGEERVQSASSTSPASAAGDAQPLSSDGEQALASGASVADINADVSPPITASPTSRKRRKFSDTREDAGQDEDVKEPQEQSCRESLSGSMDGASKTADDDDDGNRSPDIECSALDAKRRSRRTLYIEYWSRTDECKERKWDHLDEINDKYGAAEEHIFATTLNGRTAFLEPNMFPYDTPAGIEHWTLWHVNELNHEQIKQYVENWIDANAPHVERWNYDDNPERSIDIFHVHVYLQVGEDMSVLQGREVEDLMHELD